jgi:hypothetical protein
MSPLGTVSSIRILNPGSGYTSPPTVTLEEAVNGGTSSTGWTAAVADGFVTTITDGTAGDYRPTITFTLGGGADATAACTVDDTGGVDDVTVTNAGSGYTSEPSLFIESKVAFQTDAHLLLHLGTETAKNWQWSSGDNLANGRWFTREVVDAGHPLTSIEVVRASVSWTPPVSISGDGVGAKAFATLSSDGEVASVTVTDGGSGYTFADVSFPIGAWSVATATATVGAGAVTGIAVDTGGDYLPRLGVEGNAAAEVVLDASGVISSVTLTDAGSGYTETPRLDLTSNIDSFNDDVGDFRSVRFAVHFGTETEYLGTPRPTLAVPVGQHMERNVGGPADVVIAGDTGPSPFKYFEIPVPTSVGTTTVANFLTFCVDCGETSNIIPSI